MMSLMKILLDLREMISPMSEIELKLQVPPHAFAGVERAVALGASRRLRLQAVYLATADRRLAA